MPNRYANLVGANKIKDEWQKINVGFDAVQQDIDNLPVGLYRNAIINGNFDVWQRGTSFSNPPYNSYFADRWRHNGDGTLGTLTVTRQEFTPGQTDVPGNPRYYLRYAQTVAGTGQTYRNFQQLIENAALFAGQTVTVSFYAKAVSPVVISVRFFRNFGTGGSPSPLEPASNSASFYLTPVWQKFTATLQISSVSGKTFGTNKDDYLMMVFGFPINSTYTIDFAQVQLNAGDVALPFQPRSFAEELALCQRYFEKSYDIDTAPGMAVGEGMETLICDLAVGVGGTLDLFRHGPLKFKVPKRITPTVRVYNRSNGELNSVFNDSTGQHVNFANNVRFTGGQAQVNLKLENLTGLNVINAGDMVSYHWTADAEL